MTPCRGDPWRHHCRQVDFNGIKMSIVALDQILLYWYFRLEWPCYLWNLLSEYNFRFLTAILIFDIDKTVSPTVARGYVYAARLLTLLWLWIDVGIGNYSKVICTSGFSITILGTRWYTKMITLQSVLNEATFEVLCNALMVSKTQLSVGCVICR